MARYINGVNINDTNDAIRITTENETTKYYPQFKNALDSDKIDPKNNVIYDGGTVKGW